MNKSYIRHVLFTLMTSTLFFIYPNFSYADACDDINALAGYGVIGEDSFDYGNNSEINGNDISGNGNTPTPSGSSETVDLDFPDIDPSIFPATGGPDLKPPSPPSVSAGSYGTIEFEKKNNNPTLTFTGGDYFITELILKKGATVQLAPGNYFIETISFDNKSELVISPSGPVRVYLKDSFQAGNQTEINSAGNTGDLIFYLYDSASFQVGNADNAGANIDFNGIIYSPYSNTSIDFGNNNGITGAILSAGSVDVGNNTTFDYSPSVQEEVIEALGCTPSTPGPDHYQISHSGIGVTCEAETVTISAHDATDLPLVPDTSTTITLTTSLANDGWSLKSGNGTFTPPNLYTFDGVESAVEFWLRKTTATTSPHMDIDVSDGTASDPDDAGPEDPVIEFRDTALRFYANGVHNSIGTQIAGKSSAIAPGGQTLTLRAVQTNTDTGACEARISGTQSVQMAYDCVNPTSCKNNSGVSITDTTLGVPTTITDVAPGVSVDLDFDASGTATWRMNYVDAGKISLSAILNIAAVGNDPADILSTTSNEFISKPAGLCVTVPDANSDCASGDASCSPFRKAGETFILRVQAVSWQNAGESNTAFCDNAVTPNFELSNIGIAQNLIAPLPMPPASAGNIAVNSLNMILADDGVHTLNNQTISEVGVFTFTATAPDYLDTGVTIAPSTSANVGRFYPDHFILSGQSLTNRSDLACFSTFTYMEENFEVRYDLTARNSNNIVTQNYTTASGFAGLNTVTELNYGAADTVAVADLSARLVTGAPTIDFRNGVAGVDVELLDTLSLGRLATGAPDGPYTLSVGIAPVDNNDTPLDLTDDIFLNTYNLDVDGDATNDHGLIGTTDINYGRMAISNAHGSELTPLTISMKTSIYNSLTNTFIGNGSDSCTPFNVSGIDLTAAVYTAPLAEANLGMTGSGSFSLGSASFSLHDDTDPLEGPGETGDVSFSMLVPAYLQFDWDGDTVFTDNPGAKATFGIFNGDSKRIYFRQIFQP